MTEIYGKLLKAIQQMENPVKDKSAYKYLYADLSQVLGIVKPVLYENGLGLMQHVKYVNDAPFLVTTVFDESGTLDLSERRLHDFPDAQATGSYDTYTRRYELLKVFSLATDDDDGAATKGIVTKEPTELQKAQQRLLAVEGKYCELMGYTDPKAFHTEQIMTRSDYKNDAKTLNRIADELEGA